MISKKSKPVATTNITLTRTDKQPIRAQLDVLEYMAGHDPGTPVYDAEGCSLSVPAVLVRTTRTNPFKVCIKLGADWLEVLTIQPDDPAIQALRDNGVMIQCEEEPNAKARRERKEAEEHQKREAEEHEKRMRAEHARMLREQEEERKRKAIEGHNASVGP